KDGTPIAFDCRGSGPTLILIDGAFCSRAFGPMSRLATELASAFTVFTYDRRGRGDSGDTAPYAAEREIEDLDAPIDFAGGPASLLGISSGAALALEAAASRPGIVSMVLYEPPFVALDTELPDHEARLRQFLAAGRRAEMVRYFLRDMVRAPLIFVLL